MFAAVLERVLQGPEESERFGRHLRVDPTCDSSRPGQFPTQAVVVTTAARKLIELSKAGEKLQTLLLQGERDPMLHPDIREIAENLRELCNKWYPKAHFALEADALRLDTAEYRHLLTLFHRPIVRFEAGTQKVFGALSGEKPQALKQAVENLQRIELERWVLQARFQKGPVDNSTEAEVRAWVAHLKSLRPAQVQIYTVPKGHADKTLKPVTKARLEAIAGEVTEKTGLAVEILGI